jgi:hypothetical protein
MMRLDEGAIEAVIRLRAGKEGGDRTGHQGREREGARTATCGGPIWSVLLAFQKLSGAGPALLVCGRAMWLAGRWIAVLLSYCCMGAEWAGGIIRSTEYTVIY